MQTKTSSFVFPGARECFFASREEFLAYRKAWKSLTSKRKPLPTSLYAAHALVGGKDLYRAFSPNLRPSQGEPYRALLQALLSAAHLASSSRTPALLSEEQSRAFMPVWSKVAKALQASHYGYSWQALVACGKGSFAQASEQAVSAPSQAA